MPRPHHLARGLLALSLATAPALAEAPAEMEASPEVDAPAAATVGDPEVAELERQVTVLRQQWGQATMELDRLRRRNRELEAQLAAAQKRIESLDRPAAAATAIDAPAVDAPARSLAVTTAPAVDAPAAPASPPPAENTDPLAALDASLGQPQAAAPPPAVVVLPSPAPLPPPSAATPPAARPAALPPAAGAGVRVQQAAGSTLVMTEPVSLRFANALGEHQLVLSYAHAGDAPARDNLPNVAGVLQTDSSGGRYRDARAVDFNIDGQRATAPKQTYEVTNRRHGPLGKRRIQRSSETLVFELSPDLVRRIAGGQRVELILDGATAELSPQALGVFRSLQQRLDAGQ